MYSGAPGFLNQPSGLAAFLAKPGLRDLLLATGSSLLQQADQPGSLGGALGRALPVGMQAFQQAQQQAQADALIANAPPEMQALLRALPAADRVPALLKLTAPEEPYTLGPGDRRYRGAAVVAENPVAPEVPEPTNDERVFAFYQSLTPEQKKEFDAMKAAGRPPQVVVNTGEKEDFANTNTLAGQFFSQTATARDTADAVRRALAAGDSAVGDQTKIIVLNNLLDPGAIVRQDDIERVGRAGGLNTRAQQYFNQLKNGRLPKDVAAQIDREIAALGVAAKDSFAPVLEQFTTRARNAGLDPAMVTRDYFQGLDLSVNPYLSAGKR